MEGQEPEAFSGTAEELSASAEALLREEDTGTAETDFDLPAGEEMQGEEPETVIPEAKPEEDEHSVKSWAGRKFKRIQEETDAKFSEIIRLLQTQPGNGHPPADEEPELSDYPTREEILAREAWHQRQVGKTLQPVLLKEQLEAKRSAYQQEYAELLKDIDPDEEPELYALLTDTKDTTYNQAYSNFTNAAKDFSKNLTGATKALLSKSKQKQPNVQGKGGTVATGVDTSSAKTVKTFDRSGVLNKLSRDERELAADLSDDEFKRIFG